MPLWAWLLSIPGLILLIVFFVIIVAGVAAFVLIVMEPLSERIKIRRYNRRVRKHNEQARRLRLAKTSWQGISLPTGKEGQLLITEAMLVKNPLSFRQLERQLEDRAQDLGVSIYICRDYLSHGYLVEWWTPKRKSQLDFIVEQ